MSIVPFRRTSLLISEIDDFIDKVSEAELVVEQTVEHYLDHGADDELERRFEQIRAIEERGDEIRRSVANTMYSRMLMPDTRSDVLRLMDHVDTTMDDCVHLIAGLVIERPELPEDQLDGYRAMLGEVGKAVQEMLCGARAYFKQPDAVRDHVHKIGFHAKEATAIGLREGRKIFDSELPLERKRQVRDWFVKLRILSSNADDIGEQLAIFAVKRSI